MKYLLSALSTALVVFVVKILTSSILNPKKTTEKIVRYPTIYLVVGIISLLFFGAMSIISAFANAPVAVPIIFFALALLSVSMILLYANVRIAYDENSFTVKNFFGAKNTYTYEQITSINEPVRTNYPDYTRICIGEKKIKIDPIAMGAAEFKFFVRDKFVQLKAEQKNKGS